MMISIEHEWLRQQLVTAEPHHPVTQVSHYGHREVAILIWRV